MTDYVSLYNVTFQGIHFKNIHTPNSFAIYGAGFNGTGWEIQHNIQVIDCEFEGFTSAIYLNPRFSGFTNNIFHDNSNAGILLPYGYNLTLNNNTFASSTHSSLDDSTGLFREPVGLYLFDVFGTCEVSNNHFIQSKSTIGIEFLSSQGDIKVFNNNFEGGEPFLIR